MILEGVATATIKGTTKRLEAPALVVMPKGLRHDLKNEGAETLRAIGHFPTPSVTTTFEVELQPNGSKTLGTPDVAG